MTYQLLNRAGDVVAESAAPWFLVEALPGWDTAGLRVMDHERALRQAHAGDGEPIAFTAGWPSPAYRPLTKLEFARLLTSAGGMTMDGVRLAREDPTLATMWFVLDLAQAVKRDDADTAAGLDAMVATGHLTAEGKAAVLAEWPS